MDWRNWSAADRAAVTYLLLKRNLSTDPGSLRELYEIAEDSNALAELARETMGQTRTIETTM